MINPFAILKLDKEIILLSVFFKRKFLISNSFIGLDFMVKLNSKKLITDKHKNEVDFFIT